jgi:hypothetical protein
MVQENSVKRLRVMRACLAGTLVCLFLLAALPLPALAAGESIDVDPDRFAESDNVRVQGQGFDPSYRTKSGDRHYVYVTTYFSSEKADVGDEIDIVVEDYETVDSKEKVDEDGQWRVSFTAPHKLTDGEVDETVRGGAYYVYVTYYGEDVIVAAAECEVKQVLCCQPLVLPYWAYSASSECCSTRRYEYYPLPWYGGCCTPWYDGRLSAWYDDGYSCGGRYRYSYPPLRLITSDE